MQFSSVNIKAISECIEDLFGLQFQPNRESELMRAVKSAAFQFGCNYDLNELREWLCDRKLSEPEVRELSDQLTINETYFFREKTALELLSTSIVPSIIEKRNINDYPIRIWSAGCSSGEEAYSIAIWLTEKFKQINHQNLEIIATDICPKAISKALKGEYTEWSFRETEPELRLKYFVRSEKNNIIKATIQKYVTISYLNLARNCFPLASTNTENIDVIFCRNVLMYFSPDKIKEVSARFRNSLTNDGWLITSQVELNDDYFGNFKRVQFCNGIYYSKNTESKSANVVSENQWLKSIDMEQSNPKASTLNTLAARRYTKSVRREFLFTSIAEEPIITQSTTTQSEIENIKSLSNRGDYQSAIEKIDKLIQIHKDNADLYYLYANILYETNEFERAEILLIKTLYLNYNHLDAALLMAYSLKQRKLEAQSIRYFRQAMNILNSNTVVNKNMDQYQLYQMINNEIQLLNPLH